MTAAALTIMVVLVLMFSFMSLTLWLLMRSRNKCSCQEAVSLQILIDDLRAEEGSSVTIHCDNLEFNGMPNCAIYVCAEWTKWEGQRFEGDTVVKALQAAVDSKYAR